MAQHFGASVKHQHIQVHSFDLVGSELVTACDIAHTPLKKEQVDVAGTYYAAYIFNHLVFCLSLMGTNYLDFILEAWRICKIGSRLMIAEVESRFASSSPSSHSGPVDDDEAEEEASAFVENREADFIAEVESVGFKLCGTVDKTNRVFVLMEFEKIKKAESTSHRKRPKAVSVGEKPSLRPCMYKKR